MRVRRHERVLGLLLLFASMAALGCNSGPAATEGSGEGAASANADRVLVATRALEPTRTPELPTPTQPPAPAIAVPTATPPPSTATQTPAPSRTPSPTATATPTLTPSPAPTAIVIGSITLSAREQALFDAHNAERTSRGVAALSLDPTLQAIARDRAQIMADNHLFSHYAPNGDSVYDMLADAHYPWDDATENIHYNDYAASQADDVAMSEYMASPAHRANILKAGFHRVGIGVATSSAGVHYYSIVFSD